MSKYEITVDNGESMDKVGTDSCIEAINIIQDARAEGLEVEYTGDPFADFHAENPDTFYEG